MKSQLVGGGYQSPRLCSFTHLGAKPWVKARYVDRNFIARVGFHDELMFFSRSYGNLFHITDWLPTILKLAKVETDDKFDGVDQSEYVFSEVSSDGTGGPRYF